MAKYKLTDRQVQAAQPAGDSKKLKLSDGGGLSLVARSREKKHWVLRVKGHEVGLGSAAGPYAVGLATARDSAFMVHKFLRDGLPLNEAVRRVTGRTVALNGAEPAAVAPSLTFREVAKEYVKRHEKGWKSDTQKRQWWQTLEDYAYPVMGDKSPADITTADVIAVLEPIWERMPESASRLRGRIEKIIAAWKIKSEEHRDKLNVATWRGHLDAHFPPVRRLHKVKSHPALPYREVRDTLMPALLKMPTRSALALRYVIVTAGRTGEILGARWPEIDRAARLWSIPEERMKAGREHVVPLSSAALAVLAEAERYRVAGNDAVFPGTKWASDGHAIMSNMALAMLLRQLDIKTTVHGFRSSFRDWCAETGEDRQLAEIALAHRVGGVEGAYFRSQLLERRAGLMQRWADYVCPG